MKELNPSRLKIADRFNDVIRSDGNVLYPCSFIKFKIFIYLRFFEPRCWFVYGKFNFSVSIAHNLAHKSRVLCRNVFVIERKDLGEAQYFFIKIYPIVHCA